MKRRVVILLVAISGLAGLDGLSQTSAPPDAPRSPGENNEAVSVSPSGALEIESLPADSTSANEDATADLWVVSTTDRTQRARLPRQSPDSLPDDEFHFSPDEQWLFGLRHVGSGLRSGTVYHLLQPLRIGLMRNNEGFNDLVWKNGVKLGAMKRNYSGEGLYAMTFFGGWSGDSSRLLVKVCGGEEKRDMRCGFLYFNTRTNDFEGTDYSRKLSRVKSTVLACAEPVDPLAAEAELKKRFDSLDQRLNAKYSEVLAKTPKDRASVVRDAQRDWLKRREAGEKFYISLFPVGERYRRRLQFLADVTAARIETPLDRWE